MLVNILIRVLMALEVIVCLMLIGIILIQKSKGQGLGLSFGGGAAESVFGGQMGNVLTRTTVILAIAFLVNTTILAILKPQGASADVTERFAQGTTEAAAPAAAAAEAAPAASDEEIQAALDDALADVPVPVEAPAAPAPAPEAPAAE
jgi:preprotein translocase subunit SecG